MGLITGIYLSKKTLLLKFYGEKTVAVVDSVIVGGGAYDEGVSYFYQYESNLKDLSPILGRTYVGEGKQGMRIGDKIEVVFVRDHPEINSPSSAKEELLIPSIVILFSGIFFVCGFLVDKLAYK